jgi:hypothetical protein
MKCVLVNENGDVSEVNCQVDLTDFAEHLTVPKHGTLRRASTAWNLTCYTNPASPAASNQKEFKMILPYPFFLDCMYAPCVFVRKNLTDLSLPQFAKMLEQIDYPGKISGTPNQRLVEVITAYQASLKEKSSSERRSATAAEPEDEESADEAELVSSDDSEDLEEDDLDDLEEDPEEGDEEDIDSEDLDSDDEEDSDEDEEEDKPTPKSAASASSSGSAKSGSGKRKSAPS